MKKPISIVLVSMLLMLSITLTTFIASAQVAADKVEIRGDISQFISGTNFSKSAWNATSFAGFWYDIDKDKTTESMTIFKFKDSRTIDKNDLVYTTTRASKDYKVFSERNLTVEHGLDKNLNKPSSPARGGDYALVGWMAEKFVGINGKNNKLSKLVMEQDTTDKKSLTVGETWDMGDGYTLTAQSIDAKATPRQAWLVLSKDGTKLDDKVIAQGEVYTYSMKSLSGETDVPIFVTFVDSVFAGATSDMVQLKFTWLISQSVTEVKSGDKFGVFKVDSETPLSLESDSSISLSRDSSVDLAGNMKFKVADSNDNDVRFYPYVLITSQGNYEVRGTVSRSPGDTNFSTRDWDASNFAGFWYDIDDNLSTETLHINKFKDSRTIDKDDLIYTTTRAPRRYKVFEDRNLTIEHGLDAKLGKPSSPARGGFFALTGWMAEKYVALNGKNNKLSRLVLEQDITDKKSLTVGETWDLGEGYTLTAQSIDAKATPRQAWLVLSKDGAKLDDKVIAQGEVYTYSMKSLSGETDVPIFVTFVDSVFAGQTSDMVQLKFTWLISSNVIEVKSGDKFGVFKVDSETPLSLQSDGSISLSRDSTVDLAGNMKFKVSDSDPDVRFYPKVDYVIGNVTPTPTGNVTPPATNVTPGFTTPGATNVTVTIPPTVTTTGGVTPGATTPTETKKPTPGFEAGIAIFGLVVVAYLVLRQKR